MPYIICNDKNYVKMNENGLFIVSDIKEATKWKLEKSANGVLNNLKRCKKYCNYHFVVKSSASDVQIAANRIGIAELNCDVYGKVKDFLDYTKQLELCREALAEKISIADLEIVDIEHAAEFYNLNAAQGYKLYKMLHEVSVKRRAYKNELKKIELALGVIKKDKLEDLTKNISNLDNQKYSPRVYKELFGEGKVGKI